MLRFFQYPEELKGGCNKPSEFNRPSFIADIYSYMYNYIFPMYAVGIVSPPGGRGVEVGNFPYICIITNQLQMHGFSHHKIII